jgi:c(7)-type cytochrome triheme protein
LRLLSGILFFSVIFFLSETLFYQEALAQVDPVLHEKIESDHHSEKELVSTSNRVKSPSNYGSIVFNRYTTRFKELKLGKVVFPHWYHRMMFRCKVCHSDIGFIMKKGANNINMSLIIKGQFCGKCHNGIIAFSALDCYRCHSLGLKVERNHKIEKFLNVLPTRGLGNRVDWVKALEDGIIRPKASIDGKEKMIVFDKDIDFPIKVSYPHPPDVVFPHKAHTEWLFCDSCHPYVFKMKAGGNPELNMTKNFKGLYCGICHGKVAFPFEDCFRCHTMIKVPDF